MSISPITHIAFADESHHSQGQFRSIALTTLRHEHKTYLDSKLNSILCLPRSKEFKWADLRNIKQLKIALQVLEHIIKNRDKLRVDILIWNINDRRHNVENRDDTVNLQLMYYKLFKQVLLNRWPGQSRWMLHPDKQTSLNWNKVQDVLDISGNQIETQPNLFMKDKLKSVYRIHQIKEVDSKHEPIIQASDLFAGIAVYSREKYNCYDGWKTVNSTQRTLFPASKKTDIKLNGSDCARCELLDKFDGLCKNHRLGVSLKSNKGLKTLDPRNPINFWWYEPQHDNDKAPIKYKEI